MRATLAIAAAAALAACHVNLEGAPCNGPGTTTDCPSGQACGNDGKCSERAAGCVATRCDLGARFCAGADQKELVQECTGDDPICGTWTLEPCTAVGLVCGTRGPKPACECPPGFAGPDFAADPTASTGSGSPSAPPFPTGNSTPAQCRFKRLGDAVAAAAAVIGPATVRAYGPAGSTVLFGAATGEGYPLVVPSNVTLIAAAGAAETIVQGDGGSSASIVNVEGTVQGFRIANSTMTGTGVEMTCGATGGPRLTDVVVSAGAQKLANGVTVRGSCGATLERVDVSGASAAALDIFVPATAIITATGSRFHGSGVGIQATGGKLGFSSDTATGTPTQVIGNTGDGIVLTGTTTVVEASLANVVVSGNGGTGIFISMVPTASKLTMTGCDIHSNGTSTPEVYGSAGNQRTAGGILLTQSLLAAFALESNRVYANHGGADADELAFYSSGNWALNTGNCGSPNAFGCVGATSFAVRVTSGTVDARNSIWPVISPPVSGAVTWSPECPGTAPACPP